MKQFFLVLCLHLLPVSDFLVSPTPSPPTPISSLYIQLPDIPPPSQPVFQPIPSSVSRSKACIPVQHPMVTRSKTASKTALTVHSSVSLLDSEPSTFLQASKPPVWQATMLDEYQALQKQGTWRLVSLPPGKQAISSKWVFRIK